MATYEYNGLMTVKDAAGNKYLLYPITKAECVDGLEEAQRKAIEGYLDQTVFRQAVTEKHLYLAGLKDGIRLLDWGLSD